MLGHIANPKILDTFIAHIAKFNCPGMPHLPQNRLYQCGLARAVAPDNHGKPATVDMEIDMLNNGFPADTHPNLIHLNTVKPAGRFQYPVFSF